MCVEIADNALFLRLLLSPSLKPAICLTLFEKDVRNNHWSGYFSSVSVSGSGGGAVYLILRIICIASAPKSGAPSLEKK
jgi:hypothetical protein